MKIERKMEKGVSVPWRLNGNGGADGYRDEDESEIRGAAQMGM